LRFLLDTHTILWAARNRGELSSTVDALLQEPGHSFYVSAASAWEIATKIRLGKLNDSDDLRKRFEARVTAAGYQLLPVTCAHGLKAGELENPHKDPFDRMLAAQSLLDNLTLLSKDKVLDGFGVKRVW
jgi:PIN domain nuclease of toxin-antitoxin system